MITNARGIFREKWVNRLILWSYFCAFAAILGMLLYKCPYGYGAMDESFFLSIVHRLLQGDRLLVEEAHLSQFAFLTMVPEMWIYSKFVPTMEGIVLNFRYLYTVLWSAACLFLFFRTRKIHRFAAMCASLFLLPFAPYGIMAFSYNSLGILYQLNSAVFLLCAGRPFGVFADRPRLRRRPFQGHDLPASAGRLRDRLLPYPDQWSADPFPTAVTVFGTEAACNCLCFSFVFTLFKFFCPKTGIIYVNVFIERKGV